MIKCFLLMINDFVAGNEYPREMLAVVRLRGGTRRHS